MKENNREHNSIFIKKDGSPAELDTIRSWSAKWEKFLGIPFYFHSLRHYFATQMTRIGIDAELIIELVGWSTADMLKVYNDLSAKDRKWKGLDKLKAHLGKEEPTTGTEKQED